MGVRLTGKVESARAWVGDVSDSSAGCVAGRHVVTYALVDLSVVMRVGVKCLYFQSGPLSSHKTKIFQAIEIFFSNPTPSSTSGVNWITDCEPDLITRHQRRTSLTMGTNPCSQPLDESLKPEAAHLVSTYFWPQVELLVIVIILQ